MISLKRIPKAFSALLLLILVLSGCATTKGPATGHEPLVTAHQTKARQAEAEGDLRSALINWQVVASLDSRDGEAAQNVTRLRQATVNRAEAYFQKGIELLEQDKARDAQKAFLAALYLDPSHPQALLYLRTQLGGKDHALHTLKEGESLSLVAKQYYGDVYRYDLLAYFNDLDPNDPVHPGMVLTVPSLKGVQRPKPKTTAQTGEKVLEEAPEYPDESSGEMVLVDLDSREMEAMTVEISLMRRMLNEARRALSSKEYREAAVQADRVLDIDQTNSDARYLANAARYQMGKQQLEAREYEQALQALELVDPGFQDTATLLSTCKYTLAESHYRNGVKWFTEEKLQLAVEEFEEALRLNPDHPKARKDLEGVRGLIEKLRRFQ